MKTTSTGAAVSITADSTVNSAANRFPATLRVFQAYGIDSCCGGGLAIGTVAERHDLPLTELLRALNAAAAEA